MSTASDDLYAREVEYATAVAAAAFAITTLESATQDKEPQNLSGLEPSLDRIKSEKEPIAQTARPNRESESSSDEEKTKEGSSKADTTKLVSEEGSEIPEKIIHPVPSRRKRLTFSLSTKDSEETESMKPEFDTPKHGFPPPPPPPPIPSRRRPMITLSSDDFEENERMKPNIGTQEPNFPMPPPPPIPPLQPVSRPIEAQKPRFRESEADAWERVELNKIKKRYENLNMKILEWEDKRKKKAKSKLDKKTESDFGRKRDKALQVYQAAIERITEIAEGAKAQAKERQRNEELKVKDKAEKYRLTGEPPATCLCF